MNDYMDKVWKERFCDECGNKFHTTVAKRDLGYKYFSQYKNKRIIKVFCCYKCYNKYLTRLEKNDKDYVNWRDLVAKEF